MNWYKKSQLSSQELSGILTDDYKYDPNASPEEHNVESIIFLEGIEADDVIAILNKEGELAVLNYLLQWHNPGTHKTQKGFSYGSNDEVYMYSPYVMYYNPSLGYIGLDAKIQK